MFCRLKDFRRIATRYDKLARNFIAGTLFAAIAIWWINWVWTRDRGHEGRSSSPIGRPVVVRKGADSRDISQIVTK
jgi:hypothetical protein